MLTNSPPSIQSTKGQELAQRSFSIITLLCLHRIAVRWNQTGQKHAGASDIAHNVLPQHRALLWTLVAATYISLARRMWRNLSSYPAAAAVVVCNLAMFFKISFTAQDAPELIVAENSPIYAFLGSVSLVLQARAVFAGMVCILGYIVFERMVDGDRRRGKCSN